MILEPSPSQGCGRSRQRCRLPLIFVLGRPLPRDTVSVQAGGQGGPSGLGPALTPCGPCSPTSPPGHCLAETYTSLRFGTQVRGAILPGASPRGHRCFCTSCEQTEALFQAILPRVQGQHALGDGAGLCGAGAGTRGLSATCAGGSSPVPSHGAWGSGGLQDNADAGSTGPTRGQGPSMHSSPVSRATGQVLPGRGEGGCQRNQPPALRRDLRGHPGTRRQ